MKQSLQEGRERRKEGGLLAGWRVYFCEGVAGNKAPKEDDLDLIIRAAGGNVITSSNLPLPEDEDNSSVFVITNTL
eukprot:CAMPEP_0183316142 /NCGR_PEP_ID=MMETSP0160_2-20130417/53996_1 /TAXON_ID=2839 ORGANISM="Odontella Sinensis, Strain Grunow 1884" /NCGR_SAMPLE_ID=MMETSP0160_2 /ASSEMBLY_ACC=CAM_ASM_000250 /LENGTH=75 /DNA_ID=CAMNT_0025481859 /DNA_START=195 /DNA_END=419 /DNA_ORIENTATION=+